MEREWVETRGKGKKKREVRTPNVLVCRENVIVNGVSIFFHGEGTHAYIYLKPKNQTKLNRKTKFGSILDPTSFIILKLIKNKTKPK